MIIFGIIVTVIVIVMIVGAILHETVFKKRLKKIKPYGQLIDINGGKIHVYSKGSGDKTIILLPGMGVPLPCADFGPLMRKLSEEYTVVCIEHLGVGFSSETSKPRTCENYVEEIREALKKAGFKAPYVLMPHSVSSIYSEYYASKYPNEIEAIISLDGTSTAYYEEMPAIVNFVLPIAKFQQAIGTTSILASLTTNKKKLLNSGYTEKELKDIIVFAGFSINNTLLNQMKNSVEFIKDTINLPFPGTIPYLKIISKQTYETPNKQLKTTPQEYQHNHLKRIGEHAKYEILEGSHFIYLNNVEKISEITNSVLK